MTDLDKLIAAVEAGTALHQDFRAVWSGYAGATSADAARAFDAYNGSLDAALRLHEALLPGWFFYGGHLHGADDGYAYDLAENPYPDMPSYKGFSKASPARAWLLAILRALKAKGEA